MAFFLTRIDSVPVINTDIDGQLMQWLGVLVDTLNEDLSNIQDILNAFTAPSYTSTQISDMFTAGTFENGALFYDSTLDEYVGMKAGSLVKFTTTPYP